MELTFPTQNVSSLFMVIVLGLLCLVDFSTSLSKETSSSIWDTLGLSYHSRLLPGTAKVPLLSDCHDLHLDLLFVADVGQEGRQYYDQQMVLFANIIDVMASEKDSSLGSLDFSVISVCGDSNSSGFDYEVIINFGRYADRDEAKRALKTSQPPYDICERTSISGIQETAVESLLSQSARVQEDRKSLAIVVSNVDAITPSLNSSIGGEILQQISIPILTIISSAEAGQQFVYSDLDTLLAGPVFLTNPAEMATDQAVPLVLCRKCYQGWFLGTYVRHHGYMMSTTSCYTLIPDQQMHWMDANTKCATLAGKSSLATVETPQERAMLSRKVTTHLRKMSRSNNASLPHTNFVFIGLMRDSNSLGKGFQWINENPLVSNNWAPGEPYGRETRRCAFWNFTLPSDELSSSCRTSKEDTGTDQPDCDVTAVSESWSSIGCGEMVAGLALCEVQAPMDTKHVHPVRTEVSARSRELAIKKGEIAHSFSQPFGSEPDLLFSASDPELYNAMQNLEFRVYQNGEYRISVSTDNIPRYRCDGKSSESIAFSYVCDVDYECSQREDESFCSTDPSYSGLERCTSGHVIPQDGVCDLFPDCPKDQSDESRMCVRCVHLMCETGECLPTHLFTDLERDCSECSLYHDTELELDIAISQNVTDCLFICNRTSCVRREMLNNGVIDCTGVEGPLDEAVGALNSTVCYENLPSTSISPSNWGPLCIYILDVYGEVLGCRNLKHLDDCAEFVCPEGYIKCPRSYCIPVHYVMNGRSDCALREDEMYMRVNCTGLFRCSRSQICLHPDRVCDKHRDCPNGDDELNCHVTCRKGFLCLAGAVAVLDYNRTRPLLDLDFVDERSRSVDVSGVNVSVAVYNFTCRDWLYLNRLNLSRCSLTSNDIRVCQKRVFQFVEVLDLSHNFLNDSLYERNIINSSTNVINLNLSYNRGFTSFRLKHSSFSRLRHLDLSFTGISTFVLPSKSNFRFLSELRLTGTRITSIMPWFFPEFFDITHLDLREIPIQEFSPLSFGRVQISHLYTDTYKLCCPRLYARERPLGTCHAPEDPFSSCADLISGMALRCLLWMFGILAFLGNLIVFINRCFLDRSSLMMAYGHFVIHLSISDFLMGVYLLIIASADTYLRGIYFLRDTEWRNSLACKTAGFLSTVSSETSMFFILLITLDRFLVIKFPLGQTRLSGRYVHVLCGLAWFLGLLIALLPLLPPFQHWRTYTCNGVCLGLPLGDDDLPGFGFSVAIFIFLNLGLFLLIAVGQMVIYRVLSETRSEVTGKTSCPSSRRAQDIEVTKRLFLVAATDFLCWFPIGLMGLLSLTGTNLGYTAYAWSAVLVLPVNSAINPILYNVSTLLCKVRDAIRRQPCRIKNAVNKPVLKEIKR